MTRLPELKWFDQRTRWRAWVGGRWRYYTESRTESEAALRADLAEWLSEPRSPEPTVAELIVRVLEETRADYRASWGSPTNSQHENIRASLAKLDRTVTVAGQPVELLMLPVSKFGAPELAAVRDSLADDGLARTYINASLSRIRHAFRRGRELGLVSRETYSDLRDVSGFREGHARARETEPKRPIPEPHLHALTTDPDGLARAPMALSIVRVLHLTGMRVGELLRMRLDMLDRSADLWSYSLGTDHKTGRGRHSKSIWLGPKVQAELSPWIACAQLQGRIDAVVWPSRRDATRATRQPWLRDQMVRASDRLGLPRYSPHLLRHTRATETFTAAAMEAVQAVTGHDSRGAAAGYTEREALARELARRFG